MAKTDKKYIQLGERGRLNKNNKLNSLTGKEWIKFSKSWFVHRPIKRNKTEILHPAKYPESLVKEFIEFFTKEDEWVLDPFLGSGSTLLAAGESKRNAVGIELTNKFYNISKKRIVENNFKTKIIPIKGDSKNLSNILNENNLSKIRFDFVITSPPYWNQLERNSLRQKNRSKKNLVTKYSVSKKDLGNVKDYKKFIEEQAEIFDIVYNQTKSGGYLSIITNNVYFKSKLYPLAYDTAISLTNRGNKSWVLKDEKIWLQDDKPLIALGVNNAWVSNRHHQYCLIFRKEN
ncbi:MAG: site-specific DNA-methyltransferase [Ignavibacteriales bacterium CG_4_9_14_3_um_filter_30_11]|nr:MAG: site-specific DNA-methyltransferase [Ignavibacteriales bacterium CG_4_9_14_3_um_filter_30_11]